jgi:alpha-beta hydrolase superfamily lysophospholipase
MIVRSEDGTLIFCESLRAPAARGALLVIHGLGEHSGRYRELAEQAMKLKLDVHLMDLRGHGRSTGTRGHFASLDEHHQDIGAWISHLVSSGALRGDLPCFLLGHSLGGLIALTFIPKYARGPLNPELSGLCLSAPAVGLPWNPLRAMEGKLARRLPRFLQSLHVPTGISSESLTHDKRELELYLADPLVHRWITPAAYIAMERGMRSLPKLIKDLDLPLLFLLSGKDKVVDTRAAERFARKVAVAHPGKVEVRVFHTFFHEPFHESKRERAFLELKRWILKRLPTRSKKSSSRSSGKEATGKVSLH